MALWEEGWHHYQSEPPPPEGVLLEFGYYTDHWHWRRLYYHELNTRSQQNVCGLYWRWTGIGREEYAARPQPRHWIPAMMQNQQNNQDSLHCHEDYPRRKS